MKTKRAEGNKTGLTGLETNASCRFHSSAIGQHDDLTGSDCNHSHVITLIAA